MAQTNLDALKSVNAYPIPLRTLTETAERRNISLAAEASQESLLGRDYLLAKADLLLWLSVAPNISQGGQSFSFTDEQRKDFKRQAYAIYDVYEPMANAGCVSYGYKGDRL
jgi:hypothetical protein